MHNARALFLTYLSGGNCHWQTDVQLVRSRCNWRPKFNLGMSWNTSKMQKPQFGRWRNVVVLGTVKGMGNVNSLLKLSAGLLYYIKTSECLSWCDPHMSRQTVVDKEWHEQNSPLSLTSGNGLLLAKNCLCRECKWIPLCFCLNPWGWNFWHRIGAFWGHFRVQMKICLDSLISSSLVQMQGTMASNRLLSSNGNPLVFNA